MAASDIISIITLACVLIAAIANLSGLMGKRESRAAAEARMEVKLDNIYNKVDAIEKRQAAIESTLHQHEGRIIKIEESARVVHSRIDDLTKCDVKCDAGEK